MDYTFRFADLLRYQHMIVQGVVGALQLSWQSAILGFAIGIVGGFLRTSHYSLFRSLVSAYVEFVRNTPILAQLYLIYFGLTSFKIWLDPYVAAIATLGLNCGAYATEIVRAGIEAVHRGQKEAGLSLGMTHYQVFRYIILFPAIRTIFPSLGNQFILTMLGTSVVSQIAVHELTYAASMIESRTFRSFEVYFVVALLYLVLSSAFGTVFWFIERAFLKKSLKLPRFRLRRMVKAVATFLFT